eukprot:s2888_g5.t1
MLVPGHHVTVMHRSASPGATAVVSNAFLAAPCYVATAALQPCQTAWSPRQLATMPPDPGMSNQYLAEEDVYSAGAEVEFGNFRFRCADVLGRGSYGEVWRAQVLSAKGRSEPSEVALKEVLCRSQSELRQAIFEVQVLMALEQAASPHRLKLRVPRCIAYKEPGTGMNLYSGGVCSQTGQAGRSSAPARCQVNVCSGGWKVRTAMTLVPGQSLDYFLRQKPPPGYTVSTGLRRALSLEQALQPWAPIFHAWTCYREAVWQWWATVYAVFSVGGDLAPERIVEQLLLLLTRIRIALRSCAAQLADSQQARLLQMIADMLDEGKAFELRDIQRLVGGPKIGSPRRSTSMVSKEKKAEQTPPQRFCSVPSKGRNQARNGTAPAVVATMAGLEKTPVTDTVASWQSQADAVMARMASLKARFQAPASGASRALDQKLLQPSSGSSALQRREQRRLSIAGIEPVGSQDCQWGSWSAWGNCSATCDSGFQFRNRSVLVEKVGEGADCDGHSEESEPCAQQGCPRDCVLHDWEPWSDCSHSCGPLGRRKRIRDAESEIEGGRPCNESNEEYEACGLEGCPRNCIWGDWGGWSNCTQSCGKGIAFRNRIQLVVAAYGGNCVGSATQTEYCNDVPCPEDCSWNDWGEWTSCTQSCGGDVTGTKSRLRTKSGPFNAGQECVGFPTETAACNAPGGCSVNCTWEDWFSRGGTVL